jgi:UDP-2,3-diacylglucosamine pyrophosphatase LpxH
MSDESVRTGRYRALWISDVHLGTRGCKARILLDFLRRNRAQYLYLVGDIVDFWRLRRSVYWPKEHQEVLDELLRIARNGTRVVFVPGNHDEALRRYAGLRMDDLVVVKHAIHTTADGRRFLVLHGDEFDVVVRHARWLAHVGDGAYTLLLALNNWFNVVRRSLGYPYWSLSSYLKLRVKEAVNFIGNFQEAVVRAARARGMDGVICGHIHHAAIEEIDGVTYCNDGDWVESCTALAEHANGRLEIVHWPTVSGGICDEDPDRQRRLAPAGEWSDAHAAEHAARAGTRRSRDLHPVA